MIGATTIRPCRICGGELDDPRDDLARRLCWSCVERPEAGRLAAPPARGGCRGPGPAASGRSRPCDRCGAATGRVLARYCDDCRWKVRGRRPKWPLTPEREAYLRAHYDPTVHRVSYRVAAALQVPKWRVTRWAAELGLVKRHQGRPAPWTAEEDALLEEHLGRRKGLLKATPFGKDHPGRHHAWQLWPADLLAFVEAHPTAFLLGKVDQVWFLDLVFRTPRRRRTAA